MYNIYEPNCYSKKKVYTVISYLGHLNLDLIKSDSLFIQLKRKIESAICRWR